MTYPGARYWCGTTEVCIGWHPSRVVVLQMLDGDDYGKDAMEAAINPAVARLMADTFNRCADHVEGMDR